MNPIRRAWKRFTLLFTPSHRCPICRRRFVDVAKHRARRHKEATTP